MRETKKRYLSYTIFSILWITLTSLMVMWILEGGGLEAWIVLISGIVLPLAIWGRSKLTNSIEPAELEQNIRRTLHRLQVRLKEEPGIRNFVRLRINRNAAQHQIETIEDAFEQLDHFVITGKAGTGKTTLLRELALQKTRSSLQEDQLQQTPIWLNLCEWENGHTLAAFIRKQWIDIERPLENIKQRNGIVFLDGLDELGSDSQKKIRQLNKWFHGAFSPFKVIATCRTYNFPSLDVDLQTVEIADDLTDAQVCEFAQGYLGREAAETFLSLLMLDTPSRDGLKAYAVHDTAQAMADRYTNKKDIRLLTKTITKTWDRYTDERSYFKNLYQPFIQTPFQITKLFQHFLAHIVRDQLPLNLGEVTDVIARAIWSREEVRRANGWVSYQEISATLAEYAYSIKSGSHESSECSAVQGVEFSKTLLKLDGYQERVRYNQRNNYQKAFSSAWRFLLLPLLLPFILLGGLFDLLRRHTYILVDRYRLGAIESVLYRFDRRRRGRRQKPSKAITKRAQPLVDILISAGILQVVEVASHYGETLQPCVCFTDERFLEYYAATALAGREFDMILRTVRYSTSWNRIARYWDRVIINRCGIGKDHHTFLQNMAEKDAIVTAKCMLSLGPDQITDDLREQVINRLVDIMEDVQDAGEARSIECAELLYLLADESIVRPMIVTIEKLAINDFRYAIAKIIVRFGSAAVPILLDQLDIEKTEIYRSVARALGRIGDQRAQESLTKMLRTIEPSDVSFYAPTLVALIRLGDRAALSEFFEYVSINIAANNERELKGWFYEADLDVDIIPHFVDMLHQQANEQASKVIELIVFAFGEKASPALIDLLKQFSEDSESNPYTLVTVIDSLSNLGDKDALGIIRTFLDDWENEMVCLSAIKAVGQINDEKSVGKLIVLTSYSKDESKYDAQIRAYGARSLGQIGSAQATRALTYLLDDHENVYPSIWQAGEVCEFAADALRAINTQETWAIALDWYKNRLLNASKNSHEAEHAYFGLVNMATPEAWEIINQWESSK